MPLGSAAALPHFLVYAHNCLALPSRVPDNVCCNERFSGREMVKHTGRYVAYYRVSTSRQGVSGLGLEAQRETVEARLDGGDWQIVASFTEVEGASRRAGKVKHRPQLRAALACCRVMGARLVVANVSRLTRDPEFMGTLVEAGVEVEFCDMPNLEGPVGRFVLRQMLAVAELEAGMVSERTRKALARKRVWYENLTEEERAELRAKGKQTRLGGTGANLSEVRDKARAASIAVRRSRVQERARDLAPVIAEVRASGIESLGGIARALEERRIRTAQGKDRWSPKQVYRVCSRSRRRDDDVRRERCREPTPVTPHYAPFPTYKAAGVRCGDWGRCLLLAAYRVRAAGGESRSHRIPRVRLATQLPGPTHAGGRSARATGFRLCRRPERHDGVSVRRRQFRPAAGSRS